MKSLTAKSQIVLVLCHLMGRRRSFDVGNWQIEMGELATWEVNMLLGYGGIIYNGSNYSRRWRELKGEDFSFWAFDERRFTVGQTYDFWKLHRPTFTKSTNTWHLPREFCKFLRAERDRILRGVSGV